MEDRNISIIGTRQIYTNPIMIEERTVGLLQDDRAQHLYLLGRTGTGKTTLLKNLIIQDIEAGRGFALLDPHGDLAEEILDYIPRWRTKHVVYFAPADLEHPLGFNLLEDVPVDLRPLVVDGVLAVFKHIWELSNEKTPRLLRILYYAVAALVEAQGTTLLGIARMLTDERYRSLIVGQVTDPQVRNFWTEQFNTYDNRFRAEMIDPVLNKVEMITASPFLKNTLGQVKSTFSIPFVMDEERIFIANLSKGSIGEGASALLGSLLTTQFQRAAMARATVPEHERVPFHLYADEFQNFATEAFATVLSEARKYNLRLILSHQFTRQIPDLVREAILANVGSIVSFRLGEADAQRLSGELSSTPELLTYLPNFEIRAKLLEAGETTPAFTAVTHPPYACSYGRGEIVARASHERFTKPRAEVEDRLRRWLG
jgi:hypothetical protein